MNAKLDEVKKMLEEMLQLQEVQKNKEVISLTTTDKIDNDCVDDDFKADSTTRNES